MEALLHLAFPHICEGCGSDRLETEHFLCLRCLAKLPETNFHLSTGNPSEKIFWGRIPISNVTAQYYFTKDSMIQRLMHQIKYRGHKELGRYMGKLMGYALIQSNWFSSIDAFVPMPLHKAREQKRGYNQATVLCEGLSEVLAKPIINNAIIRISQTESQTRKNRIERWQNMEGRFEFLNRSALEGRHILL